MRVVQHKGMSVFRTLLSMVCGMLCWCHEEVSSRLNVGYSLYIHKVHQYVGSNVLESWLFSWYSLHGG